MYFYIVKSYIINFIAIFLLLIILPLLQNVNMNNLSELINLYGTRSVLWSSIIAPIITYYDLKRRDEVPIFNNFKIPLTSILIGFGAAGIILSFLIRLISNKIL